VASRNSRGDLQVLHGGVPLVRRRAPVVHHSEGPKQYALAFREPHPVRKDGVPDKDFIRRDTWQTNTSGERTTAAFQEFDDVLEFIRHPARNDPLGRSNFALADPDLLDKLDPCPDAVYYALDHWERPWVLLVDIDAKDIARNRAADTVSEDVDDRDDDALLNAAGILDAAPEGYPYAFEDIERAIKCTASRYEIFSRTTSTPRRRWWCTAARAFTSTSLDTDPAHRYDAKSREVLNDLLQDTYEIPIDPVVTADRRRVARLPYSLHADVCSIVLPIESQTFDVQSATPEVLER